MIYRRGGEQRTLYVHNVYNEPRSGTIELFNQELRKITSQQRQQEVGKIEHVVVGDFNAHHPAWGGPGVQIEAEAERILEIADEHDLILTTEEGIITWERKEQYSTIDLTFISNNLFNRMLCTERADDVHDSDHWPIRTTIDIQTPPNNPPKRRNWKAMDPKILRESLSQNLHVRNLSQATGPRIELELTAFLAVVRRAINDSTPWANLSVWSNPSFDAECQAAVKRTRYLRRKYTQFHESAAWQRYCRARNHKKRLVSRALRLGHRRRVQEATEEGPRGLWRLTKWARSREGLYEQGITPPLDKDGYTAETPDEKAELFRQVFFPEPPPADLSDIDTAEYPEPIGFPRIQPHEIETAVRATPPDKAPGEDGIPNSLWHKIIDLQEVQ